jgi:hypothetical protein
MSATVIGSSEPRVFRQLWPTDGISDPLEMPIERSGDLHEVVRTTGRAQIAVRRRRHPVAALADVPLALSAAT